MEIQTDDTINVGRFLVLSIDTKTSQANATRYWGSFNGALKDASETWARNPNMGRQYLVVEVQARVSAPDVPSIKTKLTERM